MSSMFVYFVFLLERTRSVNCLLCVSHFPRDVFSEHAYKTSRSIARGNCSAIKNFVRFPNKNYCVEFNNVVCVYIILPQ